MDKFELILVCLVIVFNLLLSLVKSDRDPTVSNVQEYCLGSTFNPQCSTDEVIVMEHAIYGRMKLGECIHRDFGNLGCQLNELKYFDHKCSGLQSCQVTIPDPQLTTKLTCLERSFSPYLEASYNCKKVVKLTNTCTSPKKLSATAKTKVLSSIASQRTSCGLQSTPFIIESKPGQKLNISMTDFSIDSINVVPDPKICSTYGYIMDTINDGVVTICGNQQREMHLYTSSGYSVQIMIERSILQDKKFLISYKAIGCPDITPPEYGWIQKENIAITVGCYASEDRWQLKCIDNTWVGYVGNCSPATQIVTTELCEIAGENSKDITNLKESSDMEITRNHVLIVTIGCFTLILCCIVIIAGIYCTKRYQKKAQKTNEYNEPQFPYYDQTFRGSILYKPSVTSGPNQEAMVMIPSYTLSMPTARNEEPPDVPERNRSMKSSFTNNANGHKDLLSDQEFEDNSAVKYYVLENNGDSSAIDSSQMYQNT